MTKQESIAEANRYVGALYQDDADRWCFRYADVVAPQNTTTHVGGAYAPTARERTKRRNLIAEQLRTGNGA